MTLILLPSRSPELDAVENIWQYLRANSRMRGGTKGSGALRNN